MSEKNENKLNLSFSDISQHLKSFTFPDFDVVVGIARGGVVPASLIAHQCNKPFYLLQINYRDDDNNPRYDSPVLMQEIVPEINPKKRILLVDDVSVSGRTMNFARQFFANNPVSTFALKGKADLVLYTDIRTCVHWPWNAQ